MTKTFNQIISTRRTVHHFDTTKPVTRGEPMSILKAGRLAPSAENFQPPYFVVAFSEEERMRLYAISQQPWFYHASSYVAIIGDHDKARQRPHCDLTYVDTSIALMRMFPKAEDMGLGATMVAAFDQEICRELLQTPEREEPTPTLAVGHPDPAFADKEGNPRRKTMEELVTFI